jgi:hypothetical protein
MALAITDPAVPLDAIRAGFRDRGLHETVAGTSFVYSLDSDPHGRMALILQAVGRGAQIYLFPEAFGRAPGFAQPFYAALDSAGFGMGSKAGPSISLDVDDSDRMAVFWQAWSHYLAIDAVERDR